jgi:hypothetical protein
MAVPLLVLLLSGGCGGSVLTPGAPRPSGPPRAPLPLSGTPAGGEVRDAVDRSTILAIAVLEARYSRP